MTRWIVYIMLLPIVLYASTQLPWPEIPQIVFATFADYMKVLFIFNKYVALDTLFQFAGYIVGIEFFIWLFRLIAKIGMGGGVGQGGKDDNISAGL